MQPRAVFVIVVAIIGFGAPVRAQRHPAPHPDLQGTWNGGTMTPLQRPPDFLDRATFTPAEAAEYVRTSPARNRNRLPTPTDRLTQADLDEEYVESEAIKLDGLRTSLIVDPPAGTLPPLLPSARA